MKEIGGKSTITHTRPINIPHGKDLNLTRLCPIKIPHCILADEPLTFPLHPFLISQTPPTISLSAQIMPSLTHYHLHSQMATNSLQSLSKHHHHPLSLNHHHHHHPTDSHPPAFSSFFLKPTTNSATTTTTTLSHTPTTPFALPSTTSSSTTPSTSQAISYDVLEQHLSSKNYRQADEETRRLLIVLAGEAAVKRGYVFFSEVQFIAEADLKAIDDLWRQHSSNKFGYSVQKRIWEKVNRDFTRFFLKVGWMKKLDTEVEQYNYRSFPTEFMWELTDDTPEGHLPLTNALRGTQLLNCILSHPAFQGNEEEDGEEEGKEGKNVKGGLGGLRDDAGSKPFSNRIFKTDYSF